MNRDELSYRKAQKGDLIAILQMMSEDQASDHDCTSLAQNQACIEAFEVIASDPNNDLYVVLLKGEIVGCFQLTYIPGLARQGSWRGHIEAVRVAKNHRSKGIGSAMMGFAIDLCREKGCSLVQLTSNKVRKEAHSFYGRLGFEASHEGFKLRL